MKIIITESKLKQIIGKTAIKVLESLGAITEQGLYQLALTILDKASHKNDDEINYGNDDINNDNNDENEFYITAKELNAAQNYCEFTTPLIIRTYYDPYSNWTCKQTIDEKTGLDAIKINKALINKTHSSPTATIMHELTHIINAKMSPNIGMNPKVMDQDIQMMLYLFQDTERQARLTEFSTYLSELPKESLSKNIYDYNNILWLTEMKDYINSQILYAMPFSNSLVGLYYANQNTKEMKGYIKNARNSAKDFDFFKQQNKLYHQYNKIFKEYINKATNILAYYIQKNK